MSSVNYSLKHKGVKLIPASEAWITSKNGKIRLNPDYTFVGRIDVRMPNIILSTSEKKKPTYKGNTHDLCAPAKRQIVDHFFNDRGQRNRNRVAYFGIPKKKK